MTLHVPWSDFPEEVIARIGPSARVYLTHQDGNTVATASDPRLGFILRSVTRQPYTGVIADLDRHDLKTGNGQWAKSEGSTEADVAIAAVAYVSNEETPGLWVEAFPFEPDVSDVISRMMEEFQREGALREVTAEQFTDMAKPNIVILDQREVKTMLEHYERESKVTSDATPTEPVVEPEPPLDPFEEENHGSQ